MQPTCECKNQVFDWPVDWQAMPCQGLPTKCYVQQSDLNYHSFQGTKRHVSLLYLMSSSPFPDGRFGDLFHFQ